MGSKGRFGALPRKRIPIDVLRRGVGRNGILPGADGGVAVEPGFDGIEFADGALFEELADLHEGLRGGVLRSDLEDTAGSLLCLDDFEPVFDLLDHGLLAVDILAGVHGVDGDLGMPVVGSADDDGVDVLALEDLAVVACGEDPVAPEFADAGEATVVDVGCGGDFDTGVLEGVADVALALPPAPMRAIRILLLACMMVTPSPASCSDPIG